MQLLLVLGEVVAAAAHMWETMNTTQPYVRVHVDHTDSLLHTATWR